MTDETPAEKAPRARTTKPKVEADPKLNIYQLISAISTEAGALAPEKPASGVPFAFRGVDAVVGHFAPLLRKYGVIVVPEVLNVEVTARDLPQNKAITQTSLLTRFTFYAPDGTSVSAVTAGLAQDHADRSTAQAQSVAFRVALLQTFILPTHDKEPEQAGEDTQKEIDKINAAVAAQKPAAPAGPPEPTVAELKTRIAVALKEQEIEGAAAIKAYGDKFYDVAKNPDKAGWHSAVPALKKILAAINEENKRAAVAETGADTATGEVA